jgi:ElaB/YqjD/DUF883 family membrane-anchored ribosome-binding protein
VLLSLQVRVHPATENNMSTASSASQNFRDTANDAREAARDIRQAAAESSEALQKDLQALRDDFRRLADQVTDIIAGTGNTAWRRAKSSVDEAVAGAKEKGSDAASAVRDMSDQFVEAIDESIKTRPYTTLAIVAGIAFLFGAAWRR